MGWRGSEQHVRFMFPICKTFSVDLLFNGCITENTNVVTTDNLYFVPLIIFLLATQ